MASPASPQCYRMLLPSMLVSLDYQPSKATQVTTESELNPSYIELEIGLGLGYDKILFPLHLVEIIKNKIKLL